MKVQEEVNQRVSESEASTNIRRKRRILAEKDSGAVRVKLPDSVGSKARETIAALRERGAQVTLDELLSEYVEAIPDRYFEAQLQKRTPEPYYLEAAAKVPDLREMLIRLAKKGLLRNSPAGLETRAPRKPRKQNEEAETEAVQTPEIGSRGE